MGTLADWIVVVVLLLLVLGTHNSTGYKGD